jgi:hypothetical protein
MKKQIISVMSTFLLWILIAVNVGLAGCNQTSQPTLAGAETQAPSPTPQTVTSFLSPSPVLPLKVATATPKAVNEPRVAPKVEEIKAAVTRVFENVAAPDPAHTPDFVVGDFNGDASEDIAIVVKPNDAKLAEVNSELANWILEDPRAIPSVRQEPARRKPGTPAPVRAEKGEALLAIIHGVGPEGWRNSEAKQSFLLKHGAGANMLSATANDVRKSKTRQKLPAFRGDVITETVGGQSGLVFWTGAKYGWYSPRR